jgi:hypothetical protein
MGTIHRGAAAVAALFVMAGLLDRWERQNHIVSDVYRGRVRLA